MNGTFIPRYLDSLPQIFWWEIDELAVLFVCIFLGIVTKFLTYLIVVGIVSTLVLSKMKNGKDRKSTRLNSSHLKLSRMPSSA